MNTLVSCFSLLKITSMINMDHMHQCMYFCFIGDMYTPENGESEPDWVQTEKKHFSEFRDTDKVKEK